MLNLSRRLSDDCSKELHILSCWDYAIESELRNNAFIKMPSEQIDQNVDEAKLVHRKTLDSLIEDSSISGSNHIHHLRGKPENVIPEFVKETEIDILVMGTIARTGIPGFFIGNTAENIMQTLPCSVLALKPQGFVSPVKAY
jgi:nucleotide-binding universal stress UspA family protein